MSEFCSYVYCVFGQCSVCANLSPGMHAPPAAAAAAAARACFCVCVCVCVCACMVATLEDGLLCASACSSA